MDKVLIIIAGMPGTGKTRFANYLSHKLQKSLICKDKLKEIIWDKLHYDAWETQKYGGFEFFKKVTQLCRDFDYGDCIITVDTTDFSKVSYNDIFAKIINS
ncbi:hypothetical protein [Candidatus Clostridium radicumherbarum]|uniref:ATP-binding protein n=1 Tax=Candidatus Clostridium radicumherbarum TaxID=3381662 RepID=A0ABW8TUH0_9CLOT